MRLRRTRGRSGAIGALAAVALLTGPPSLAGQEAEASDPALVLPSAPPKPPGGMARWLDPATAPFIPIPEIDVDPQSGVTLGVIATFLDVSERGEIERITAPDVYHSQYFGWGAGVSLYGFPSQDNQWLVTGDIKQRVERSFDARYLAGQTRSVPLSWSIDTLYNRSGTARFFGIGNETVDSAESTYLNEQAALAVSIGYNFTPALQLAYGAHWRYVDVQPGVLSGIPSIETLYPTVSGLGREHALEHSLSLTYDTRDSTIVPRSGARYLLYGGFANHGFASSVAYSFVGADARGYWPFGERCTLAWHAAARYMPSASEAPFWALSSLGGDRSITGGREPLRSDGADRYVDENLLAAGAELRTRVAGFQAFGTHVSLELAPFVDVGKVFANGGGNGLSDMHIAGGVGVRGIASPYVVGYVDVGYGRGKAVVFTGINYPF